MSNSQQKVLNYEGLQHLYTGLNSIFARKTDLTQIQTNLQSALTNLSTIQTTLNDYSKYITITDEGATFIGNLDGAASQIQTTAWSSSSSSGHTFYFSAANSSTNSSHDLYTTTTFQYTQGARITSSTTSVYDTLTIGHDSASTGYYNPRARIYLRNGKGGGAYLLSNSSTSTYTLTLPNKTGTLAVTSQVSAVSSSLSTLSNTVDTLSTTVESNSTKLSSISEGAEVNQNTFSSFNIGDTSISSGSKTDTLTFIAGDNVELTPNNTDKTITIKATTPPTTIDNTLSLSGAAADAKATGERITAATSAMNTALENYVLSSTLTSTLGSYVTNTSLNSTLSNYAKASDLNTLDSKVTNIIGGVSEEELNTLKELSDALNNDADFAATIIKDISDINLDIQALNTSVGGKAPTSHASTGTTYGVANASYYGHAMASSTTPKANGTATVGTETAKFARGDHVHPLQTTVSGNAGTATKFASAQTITLTGDVTGSASSQAGWSITTTLGSSGVTAASYGPSSNASPAHGGTFSVPYFTVDSKGRVTSASTKTITLPASGNTDTKVTQAAAISTNGDYPVLLGYSTATTSLTNTVNKTSSLLYNPSTQLLSTSNLKVNGRFFIKEITGANTTTDQYIKFCTITRLGTPANDSYSTIHFTLTNEGYARQGRLVVYYSSSEEKWYVSSENDIGNYKYYVDGSSIIICANSSYSIPAKIIIENLHYDSTYYSVTLNSGEVVDTTDYSSANLLYSKYLQQWLAMSIGIPTSTSGYVTNYYPVLHSTTSYNKFYNTSVLLQGHTGTTSELGYFNLVLGNNTATGTEGNMYGQVRLYGVGSGYYTLRGSSTNTSNSYTSYLPTVSGTLLNTGNYSSYVVPKTGGTFTGNISIQDTYYPTAKFYPTYNTNGFNGQFEADYSGYMQLWANDDSSGENRRGIAIYGHTATSNPAEAIKFRYADEGTYGSSLVYTEQNIVASTTEPTNPVKGMIWLELEA